MAYKEQAGCIHFHNRVFVNGLKCSSKQMLKGESKIGGFVLGPSNDKCLITF